METWRRIIAVCFLVLSLVIFSIFVFVSGVFFAARYPNKSVDAAAGVLSNDNRTVDFNVTLEYREYLHFEFVSQASGTVFNVSLTTHPVYAIGSSEEVSGDESVAYKSLYGESWWSYFSNSFDLLLPHDGSWKFQIVAEGMGELGCKVTKITPGDANDLVAPALTAIPAILLPSMLALAIFSLVQWRKKPPSKQKAQQKLDVKEMDAHRKRAEEAGPVLST